QSIHTLNDYNNEYNPQINTSIRQLIPGFTYNHRIANTLFYINKDLLGKYDFLKISNIDDIIVTLISEFSIPCNRAEERQRYRELIEKISKTNLVDIIIQIYTLGNFVYNTIDQLVKNKDFETLKFYFILLQASIVSKSESIEKDYVFYKECI